MIFTQTPQNGASLYRPLIYAFGDEAAPRDLEIEVLDLDRRQKLATKRLYNTSSGMIEIAPVVRRTLNWQPEKTPLGFSAATDRVAHVQVRVEGVSVARCFLPYVEESPQPLLFSTLPLKRLIARGEGEELLLDRDVLYAELERFTPKESTIETFYSDFTDQPALFRFTTAGMEPEVERLELRLYSTTREVILHYTLTNPIPGGMRVAWVGRGGSVEHYTFPIVERCSELQERDVAATAEGGCELLRGGYRRQWQLLSAYETPERLKALVELGTSPCIWIVSNLEGYLPVEVVAGERQILHQGLLTSLSFTLLEPLKEINPWS